MKQKSPYILPVLTALVTGIFLAFVLAKGASVLTAALTSKKMFFTTSATGGNSSVSPRPVITSLINSEEESVSDTSSHMPIDLPVLGNGLAPVTASHYIVIPTNALFMLNAPPRALAQANDTILVHNAFDPVPIASLTKLATAVVALQHENPRTQLSISKELLSTYGNTAGFRLDEKIRVGELLYPLLIVSSNDAGEALASAYPATTTDMGIHLSGRDAFIQEMNRWAASIGASHTHFVDPTGLSPENVSSPADVALMLAWINAHEPSIIAMTHIKVKNLRLHTWVNPTQFLNISSYVGGKNGYLPEAGLTGASIFNIKKAGAVMQYVVVVLDSSKRDRDVIQLLRKIDTDRSLRY